MYEVNTGRHVHSASPSQSHPISDLECGFWCLVSESFRLVSPYRGRQGQRRPETTRTRRGWAPRDRTHSCAAHQLPGRRGGR
eukprot:1712369-Rhodomonas_salina.5